MLVAGLVAILVAACGAPATPSPSPVAQATAAATPTGTPTPTPTPTATPSPTPSPSPSPRPSVTPPSGRPTRIAIPAIDIDLPVVPPPRGSRWPLCDVAEYFKPPVFQHPGEGGVTYLYAHAQAGMFLPILRWSNVDADRLVGDTVLVWTTESHLYTYRVTRVRRHQKSLAWAYDLPANYLVLQTSENQYKTGTKVMLVARPLGGPVATSYRDAHPKARPRVCGP